MKVARTILTLVLSAVCVASGHQTVRVVHVGGDVPKPGPVTFEDQGMTIDSALAAVGMDIKPFYAKKGDNDDMRCPIKVLVYHKGKKTVYDPSVDSDVMQKLRLELNDLIGVTDFRQHPKKIETRKERIEKMLVLGSTDILDELLSLSTLQYEYAEWLGQAEADANGSTEYLKKEAARLVDEGKGQKIIGLLELKLGALKLDGLGHAHPTILKGKSLIQIYRDLITK